MNMGGREYGEKNWVAKSREYLTLFAILAVQCRQRRAGTQTLVIYYVLKLSD